jgi:hypothetical protein
MITLRRLINGSRRRLQALKLPPARAFDLKSKSAVEREIANSASAPRRKQAPDRDLVMGLATNYTTRELGPFVRSLRATGYDGDVVLWTLDVDPATAAFLHANRIMRENFWEGQFLPMTPTLSRFFCYYRFLHALDRAGRPYRRVFISDVRDVVFQANPFDTAMPKGLVAFLEEPSQTIGSCQYNARWIREAFGKTILKQIGGERISCCGTLLGSWQGILNYLLMMQLCTYEIAPHSRFIFGIDQGIHNYLLCTGRLDRVAFDENAKHVWSLHYVPGTDIFVTPQQRIADGKGHVSAVVHQYDRHPILAKLVAEKFGDTRPRARARATRPTPAPPPHTN